MSRFVSSVAALVFMSAATACGATTWSGNLGDVRNGALVGSGLGAPEFTDSAAIANNIALYTFTIGSSATVSLVSTGFAAGGIDPYFSLFSGSGAGATFLDSNYAQAFSTGGDFSYSALLGAGTYSVAIGSFANLSFAENLGTGALGEGFTGLGDPNALHAGSYTVTVSSTPPVPEPASDTLWMVGFVALALLKAHRFNPNGVLK